jgi:hypothetical protein
MKNRSLFNEYEMYTDEGAKISHKCHIMISDFLNENSENIKLNDLRNILFDVVDLEICVRKMKRSVGARKKLKKVLDN